MSINDDQQEWLVIRLPRWSPMFVVERYGGKDALGDERWNPVADDVTKWANAIGGILVTESSLIELAAACRDHDRVHTP